MKICYYESICTDYKCEFSVWYNMINTDTLYVDVIVMKMGK